MVNRTGIQSSRFAVETLRTHQRLAVMFLTRGIGVNVFILTVRECEFIYPAQPHGCNV